MIFPVRVKYLMNMSEMVSLRNVLCLISLSVSAQFTDINV